MFEIVVPIFLVILVGYGVGKRNTFGPEAEKLINHYVLFIALPALLFLAVARADPSDFAHWQFILATLAGIAVAYIAGIVLGWAKGIASPRSSLIGMTSCYGTTGYMGIPILVAAFGSQAAVPAAIATILHNIPAIMTVIVTHETAERKGSSFSARALRAFLVPLKNPLTIAVLAGAVFALIRIPLPPVVVRFSEFLAGAAGPTALFALGLGLAGIPIVWSQLTSKMQWLLPTVAFKIVLQPVVTTLVLILLVGRDVDIWFATAIVMAAQPIGAGAYVFAKKYGYFSDETSIGIIASLIVSVVTMPIILAIMKYHLV